MPPLRGSQDVDKPKAVTGRVHLGNVDTGPERHFTRTYGSGISKQIQSRMPMLITVDNIKDARLDVYRDLTGRSDRRDSFFIVEGALLVERLIASRFPTVSIVTTRATAERFLGQVKFDVPTFVVSNQEIRELVGFEFHRGVLAWRKAIAVSRFDKRSGRDLRRTNRCVVTSHSRPGELGRHLACLRSVWR